MFKKIGVIILAVFMVALLSVSVCAYYPDENYDCNVDGHIFQDAFCIVCGDVNYNDPNICDITGGWHEYDQTDTCIYCGYNYNYGNCNHNFSEWVVVVEPTCVQGYNVRSCSICGYEEYDYYSAVYEHDYLNGNCIFCGKIAPTDDCNHLMGVWKIQKEPTCSIRGLRERSCVYCDLVETEAIPIIDHSWSEGVCTVCGAGSLQNCEHDFDYVVTHEPDCENDGEAVGECSYCGHITKRTIKALGHSFSKGICERCGIEEGHVHEVYRTVILGEKTHVSLCSCGKLYEAQDHAFSEQYTIPPTDHHKPMLQKVVCTDCGYERIFYVPDPDLKTHSIQNGEKISYNELFAFDCLYYKYTDKNNGEGEFFVISDNDGSVLGRIVLPSLLSGEKLLVDTKSGYYSIWDDKVSEVELSIESSSVWEVGDYYYNFDPDVETVPSELSRYNAYFKSDYLERYNYPVADASLLVNGWFFDYPFVGRGSSVNIQLISFPQESQSVLRGDLDNYPLTLVIYDFLEQACKSVADNADSFTSSFMKVKKESGMSNGYTPSGDSYERGYADAYNMLTNAVISEAPVQGLIQGMWYGVLAMVTILGNGISIGGISLFSVLVTVLIVCLVYLLLKVIRK